MATKIKVGKKEFYFTSNLDAMSEEEQNEFYQHTYWPSITRVVYDSFDKQDQILISNAMFTHGAELVDELIDKVHSE